MRPRRESVMNFGWSTALNIAEARSRVASTTHTGERTWPYRLGSPAAPRLKTEEVAARLADRKTRHPQGEHKLHQGPECRTRWSKKRRPGRSRFSLPRDVIWELRGDNTMKGNKSATTMLICARTY